MTKLEKLYKRTKTGATQEWQIIVEGDSFYTLEGQVGGVITQSKPTVCKPKNEGHTNSTTSEVQALKEAQAKWTKKTESGYTTDINSIDTATKHFEPMLCRNYDDEGVDFSRPIFSQCKLDGARCITTKDGMWSRNGKPFVACPHIQNILKPLFDKYPDLKFDGELYTNDYADDFNKIISLIKKSKPNSEDIEESAKAIEYWIYDFPSAEGDFVTRYNKLVDFLDIIKDSRIVVVPTIRVTNQEHLDQLFYGYMADGYEGQIIRYGDAPYQCKRSKHILKRKEFSDMEFKILGIGEGEGNKTGIAGFMEFEIEGKPFTSNIKGTHVYLEKLWKNKKDYIGKMATVKYFNLTPAGIPRFPYVIAIDRQSYE